jgi:hypothetical protein
MKGTTGSLVLARSLNVAHDLSGQFQRRTVDKTYLALVRGGSRSFPQTSGQIRTFLEFPNGRASLVPQGQLPKAGEPKESRTDWELVASSVSFRLVFCGSNFFSKLLASSTSVSPSLETFDWAQTPDSSPFGSSFKKYHFPGVSVLASDVL